MSGIRMLLAYQHWRAEKAAEWGDPRQPPALVPAAWAPSLAPPEYPMQLLAGAAAACRPQSPARPAPPLLSSVIQSSRLLFCAFPALLCTGRHCVDSLENCSKALSVAFAAQPFGMTCRPGQLARVTTPSIKHAYARAQPLFIIPREKLQQVVLGESTRHPCGDEVNF